MNCGWCIDAQFIHVGFYACVHACMHGHTPIHDTCTQSCKHMHTHTHAHTCTLSHTHITFHMQNNTTSLLCCRRLRCLTTYCYTFLWRKRRKRQHTWNWNGGYRIERLNTAWTTLLLKLQIEYMYIPPSILFLPLTAAMLLMGYLNPLNVRSSQVSQSSRHMNTLQQK